MTLANARLHHQGEGKNNRRGGMRVGNLNRCRATARIGTIEAAGDITLISYGIIH
jgi:hypothetical protein